MKNKLRGLLAIWMAAAMMLAMMLPMNALFIWYGSQDLKVGSWYDANNMENHAVTNPTASEMNKKVAYVLGFDITRDSVETIIGSCFYLSTGEYISGVKLWDHRTSSGVFSIDEYVGFRSADQYLSDNDQFMLIEPVIDWHTFQIGFDKNGGTGNEMNSMECRCATTPTLPTCTYTKSGYKFNGWALASEQEKAFDDGDILNYTEVANLFSAASGTPMTVTLYATWVLDTTVPEGDGEGSTGNEGGTITPGGDDSTGGTEGDTTIPGGPGEIGPKPERGGACLLFWYMHEVDFVIDEATTETVTVRYGERIAAPEVVAPEGYEFTGWYTDADCTEAFDLDTKFHTSVIREVETLYAGFAPVEAEDAE